MKIITIIIFLLLAPFLYAQNWVIKGGINHTTITHVNGNRPKSGFIGGVAKNWKTGEHILLTGELLYSLKGGDLIDKRVHFYPGIVSVRDIYWSMNYVDMNVLVNYPLIKKRFSKLQLVIGPSLSIAVKDNSGIEIKPLTDSNFPDEDQPGHKEYDYANKVDITYMWLNTILGSSGFAMNCGMSFSWKRFLIDFRYHLPLHEIYMVKTIQLDEKFHSVIIMAGIVL